MNNYNFDFASVTRESDVLIQGLVTSVKLTAAANVVGLTCGFILALMVMSKWKLVRVPAILFVEFFRCTPALVQIVWFYYCVPILFDIYIDSFIMGILALGMNLTAFNAEAYRASIQAVPREQLDAGVALGLNFYQRVWYIVFPSAFRASVPVLMTNAIGVFQQSALVAMIAIPELMFTAKTLATQSYRPIETFTVVALMYFAVSFPVAQIVEKISRNRNANAN